MFDWVVFLNRHGIEWSEGGTASRGNISIQCAFCGTSDQGSHLAISLSGKGWRCFRSREHRGKSPVRLIQALLRCSYEEARKLADLDRPSPARPDSVMVEMHDRLLGKKPAPAGLKSIKFLKEFRPISEIGTGRYFVRYLLDERDYRAWEIEDLQKTYGLQYTTTGPFAWRIIFPVYMHGKLVNWTGRSIKRDAFLRYRTLSADPEVAAENDLPVATLPIEATLLNYDLLYRGGRELVINEGPFDALRTDFFGVEFGVRATCVYTQSISSEQLTLLEVLRDRFDYMTLMLDQDAKMRLLGVGQALRHLDLSYRYLPAGRKDPALVSWRELSTMFRHKPMLEP